MLVNNGLMSVWHCVLFIARCVGLYRNDQASRNEWFHSKTRFQEYEVSHMLTTLFFSSFGFISCSLWTHLTNWPTLFEVAKSVYMLVPVAQNGRNRYVHDDVINWNHFPRYWSFVQGIHRSPVNSPHKGQKREALMFAFICAWTNAWVNNQDTGDYRRHRAHYAVTVMLRQNTTQTMFWNVMYQQKSNLLDFYKQLAIFQLALILDVWTANQKADTDVWLQYKLHLILNVQWDFMRFHRPFWMTSSSQNKVGRILWKHKKLGR